MKTLPIVAQKVSISLLVMLVLLSGCTAIPAIPGAAGPATNSVVTPTMSAPTPEPTRTPLPTITPTRTRVAAPASTPTLLVQATKSTTVTVQAPGSTNVSLVEYVHQGYPFRVSLPHGWHIEELNNEAAGVAALSSSDEKQPGGTIIITFDKTKPTPAATLEQVLVAAAQDLGTSVDTSDFKAEAIQQAGVNGLTGLQQCYTFQRSKTPTRQCVIILLGAANIYTITMLAPQAAYPQYNQIFAAILATFREV